MPVLSPCSHLEGSSGPPAYRPLIQLPLALLSFPLTLFTIAFFTDISDLQTAEDQWTNILSWLIVRADLWWNRACMKPHIADQVANGTELRTVAIVHNPACLILVDRVAPAVDQPGAKQREWAKVLPNQIGSPGGNFHSLSADGPQCQQAQIGNGCRHAFRPMQRTTGRWTKIHLLCCACAQQPRHGDQTISEVPAGSTHSQ